MIRSADGATTEGAGLITWNEFGYLILCLSSELRRRASRFVTLRTTEDHLTNLAGAFPALVDRAKAKVGLTQITRVLRRLVAEGISIRNLRTILEGLLAFDYVVCDAGQLVTFDDRLPIKLQPEASWLQDPQTLADFVRIRLKRYISYRSAFDGSTILAYLLAPEVETLVGGVEAHGASHQTGSTGVVAKAIQLYGYLDPEKALAVGKEAAFLRGISAT